VLLLIGFVAGWLLREAPSAAAPRTLASSTDEIPPEDGKLRIFAFGAHPDDCESRVGGTAAKWAALGHHVKLAELTSDFDDYELDEPKRGARRPSLRL
jgi:hypothetical protein